MESFLMNQKRIPEITKLGKPINITTLIFSLSYICYKQRPDLNTIIIESPTNEEWLRLTHGKQEK